MQERHLDRQRYFSELANTSREYYINYVSNFISVDNRRILEVGCGEGGNLLPFAEIGCEVTGVDRSKDRISLANSFFGPLQVKARFLNMDFFDMECVNEADKYDVVLVHDVIEHITQKDRFFSHLKQFVSKGGIVFWRFPAWQMPFGGHQQICHSGISKLPFIHLLPERIYRYLLTAFGESKPCIEELIDIKKCRVSVEKFEKIAKRNNYLVADRCLWLINPHYKQKFNLKPRKLRVLSHIKYFRNYFSTSCFYITRCV
jgi:SAM-dependent methyltransferase